VPGAMLEALSVDECVELFGCHSVGPSDQRARRSSANGIGQPVSATIDFEVEVSSRCVSSGRGAGAVRPVPGMVSTAQVLELALG
jgi:hypothetical protein